MELWICRHAETISNKMRMLQGQMNSPFKKELTKFGCMQTKLVARRLSKIRFDQIITSDLERTVITAKEIISLLENKDEVPFHKSRIVREKSSGVLEGKPLGINRVLANKNNIDHRLYRPFGGENSEDLFNRAEKFLLNLIDVNVKPSLFNQEFVNKIDHSLDIEFEGKMQEDDFIKYSTEENKNEEYCKSYSSEESKNGEKDLKEILEEINQIAEEMKVEGNKIDLENFNYDEKEVDEYLKTLGELDMPFENYEYDPSSPVKRVLLVSHSGFISELINVVRKMNNLMPNEKNVTNNAGIHVIRIQCNKCGPLTVCKNEFMCNEPNNKVVELNYLVNNDIKHLNVIKK